MNPTKRVELLLDEAKKIGLINPITGDGMPSISMLIDVVSDAESDGRNAIDFDKHQKELAKILQLTDRLTVALRDERQHWTDFEAKAIECERLRARITVTKNILALLGDRITQYLSIGGLFNPEHMDHDKVRDLLIDTRAAIYALCNTNTVIIKGTPFNERGYDDLKNQQAERERMEAGHA
jgi:hypothetical protein